MKIQEYPATVHLQSQKVDAILICITDEDEEGDSSQFEKLSYLDNNAKDSEIVLLHINVCKDTPYITGLIIERIEAHTKKIRYDTCICISRPDAQEFRNRSYWRKCFHIPYENVHQRAERDKTSHSQK